MYYVPFNKALIDFFHFHRPGLHLLIFVNLIISFALASNQFVI